MLQLVYLDYGYTQLITLAKERISEVLQVLQTKKYTITNIKEEKSPRIYAQLLFSHFLQFG